MFNMYPVRAALPACTVASAAAAQAEPGADMHMFPAAHEDAWAAHAWVIGNVQEINGDAARTAVAGDDMALTDFAAATLPALEMHRQHITGIVAKQ